MSFDNALRVWNVIKQAQKPLGLPELARAAGVSRMACERILDLFMEMQLVRVENLNNRWIIYRNNYSQREFGHADYNTKEIIEQQK